MSVESLFTVGPVLIAIGATWGSIWMRLGHIKEELERQAARIDRIESRIDQVERDVSPTYPRPLTPSPRGL